MRDFESRSDKRLKARVEESTCLTYTLLVPMNHKKITKICTFGTLCFNTRSRGKGTFSTPSGF